jgi:hypothetical protein
VLSGRRVVTDGPVLRRADDIPETGLTVRDMVLNHEARLRAVEDWRVEMRTLAVILKATFGVSLVGAAIGIINLLDLVAHASR